MVEKFKFFSLFVFGENKTKNRIIGFSYLFKTPEQTSPVRRSLPVQKADYKSKAVHRLSELVTIKSFEAMRACALFKTFLLPALKYAVMLGEKKKMFAYKRKENCA